LWPTSAQVCWHQPELAISPLHAIAKGRLDCFSAAQVDRPNKPGGGTSVHEALHSVAGGGEADGGGGEGDGGGGLGS